MELVSFQIEDIDHLLVAGGGSETDLPEPMRQALTPSTGADRSS